MNEELKEHVGIVRAYLWNPFMESFTFEYNYFSGCRYVFRLPRLNVHTVDGPLQGEL